MEKQAFCNSILLTKLLAAFQAFCLPTPNSSPNKVLSIIPTILETELKKNNLKKNLNAGIKIWWQFCSEC